MKHFESPPRGNDSGKGVNNEGNSPNRSLAHRNERFYRAVKRMNVIADQAKAHGIYFDRVKEMSVIEKRWGRLQ